MVLIWPVSACHAMGPSGMPIGVVLVYSSARRFLAHSPNSFAQRHMLYNMSFEKVCDFSAENQVLARPQIILRGLIGPGKQWLILYDSISDGRRFQDSDIICKIT